MSEAQPSLQYGKQRTAAEQEMYRGGISHEQINEFRGDSGQEEVHHGASQVVPRTREICGQSCLYDAGIQTLGFKAAYLQAKIHVVQASDIPPGFCETQRNPPELETHCLARFKAVFTLELIRVRGQIAYLMEQNERLLTYRNPQSPQTSEIVRREEVAAPDGHAYAELTPQQNASSIARQEEASQISVLRRQKAVMVTGTPSKYAHPSGSSTAGSESGIREGFSVVQRVESSEVSRESVGRIIYERDKNGRPTNRPRLDQQRQRAYDQAMRLRLRSLVTHRQVPADLTTQRDDEIYSSVVKETRQKQEAEARVKGGRADETPVYSPIGLRAPQGTHPGTHAPSAVSNTKQSEDAGLDVAIDQLVNKQLGDLE